VIARNSSFAFRGKAMGVAEVGRKLGVAYVLEGSVRRAGSRIRITAQLIEAASGVHLWADRYDRELDDIFDAQDEVAQTIVATLVGRVEEARLQQSLRKPTVSLKAYELALRGLGHLRGYAPEDNAQALRMFEAAAEIDPDYGLAHAYSGLASLFVERDANAGDVPDAALASSLEKAEKGVRLDPRDGRCQTAMSTIRLLRQDYDLAEHHARQAVLFNPNDADVMAMLAHVMARRGRHEEALSWIEKAKRLNPLHPPYYDAALGTALSLARRYVEAVQVFTRLPGLTPSMRVGLAACYARLERAAEAHEHVAELLRKRPDLGADHYVNRGFAYERREDREHLREGLIKAGLPE
jgi:tetratricopeptide (TPR) repeat protein